MGLAESWSEVSALSASGSSASPSYQLSDIDFDELVNIVGEMDNGANIDGFIDKPGLAHIVHKGSIGLMSVISNQRP